MKKIHLGLVVALLASIALLAATRISDPDTMQYLASGRYMMAHGLERGCVFNYSSDQCQVVTPQWFFHVMVYGVYLAGGWNALVVFQIAIAVGVFALILVAQRKQGIHPLVAVPFLLLTVMVASERFILRADLFALLPAVLLYYLLERYWDLEDRSPPPRSDALGASRGWLLAALAGVQVIWVNTHGSFPIGFILLGAYLADALLGRIRDALARRRKPPRLRPGARRMLIASAVILAASLLNPYGLESFLQPFRFILKGEAIAPQLEFASPFAPADLEHLTVSAYKVLLGVLLAVLALSFRAIRTRDVLILGPLVYLSTTGMRYLALFAVFCAVLLPRYLEELRSGIARWLRRGNRLRPGRVPEIAVSALLLAAMAGIGYAAATNALYRFDAISRRTGFGLSDLVYPAAASDFVERNNLAGNMFNDYSVGTYLNWRLFPARKTYIDGHSYTPARLHDYRQMMAGAVPYPQIVEKHDINYFLLSHKASEARSLIAALYRDPQWALVHFDEMAMIFLKRIPENQPVIARYGIDLASSATVWPRPLANIHHPADFYLGHTDTGLILSALDLSAQATAELLEAARENPRSFVTQTALGLLLETTGDGQRALEAAQSAVRARRGYAPGHFWLGVLYLRHKRANEAIAEIGRALRINPRIAEAHYYLGAALETQGDRRRALEEYRKEIAADPTSRPAQAAIRRLTRAGS